MFRSWDEKTNFSSNPLRLVTASQNSENLYVFGLENQVTDDATPPPRNSEGLVDYPLAFQCSLCVGALRFLDYQFERQNWNILVSLELRSPQLKYSTTTKTRLRWWDITLGESTKSVGLDASVDANEAPKTQFLHCRSKLAVALLNSPNLRIWDAESGALLVNLDWALERLPEVSSFTICPTSVSCILLSYCKDGKNLVELRDIETQKAYQLQKGGHLVSVSAAPHCCLVAKEENIVSAEGTSTGFRYSKLQLFRLHFY